MALPRIRIDVEADTRDAEAGLNRVEQEMRDVGRVATITGGQVGAMSTRFRNTARDSRVFGRGIQNAAFQLGDFATQVGAGTSASIALGQQLPQLFVGFGTLGAVIGAVVAIAIPLARSLSGLTSNTEALNSVLGTTRPLFDAIARSIEWVRDAGVQMAEVILNNFDRIVIIAGTAAVAFGTRLVAGLVAARIATISLAASMAFLRAALIRTGIGALIVGAGELVYQFTRLSSAVGGTAEAFSLIGSVASEVFERIRISASLLGEIMGGVGMMISGAFQVAFGTVQQAWNDLINNIITGVNTTATALNSVFGTAFGQAELVPESPVLNRGEYNLSGGQEIIGSATSSLGAALSGPLQSVQAIRDTLASIRDENITLPELLGAAASEEEGGGSALDRLDENLTAQEERIRQHFDRIKALTTGGLSDKLGAWGDYFNNLVSLTGTQNERLLSIGRAFKAGQALIDAWSAFNQVLSDPSFIGRPFARIAAAGQVLAAGIGAVNAIKQAVSGGGGPKSSSGGRGGGRGGGRRNAGSIEAEEGGGASGPRISLTLIGEQGFTRAQITQIAEAMNDSTTDGQRIIDIRGRR